MGNNGPRWRSVHPAAFNAGKQQTISKDELFEEDKLEVVARAREDPGAPDPSRLVAL